MKYHKKYSEKINDKYSVRFNFVVGSTFSVVEIPFNSPVRYRGFSRQVCIYLLFVHSVMYTVNRNHSSDILPLI